MLKSKKFISFLTVALAISMMMSSVFAFGGIDGEVVTPTGGGELAGKIIGIMRWIGYAIAIGMLVYIGIKYIMASADEKATLKGALIKYVVGAILIVFAVTIANAIFNIQ